MTACRLVLPLPWFVALALGVVAFPALAQRSGVPEANRKSTAEIMKADEPMFLDGFFPIGVFSQPTESFSKWKERGINTLLETPQNHDAVAWDRAARELDLKVIRRPLPNPRDDIGRADLLAWSHWDEPDAAGRAPQWTPLFEKTYREWRQIDPQRKVFLNLAGPDLTWFCTRQDQYSRDYAAFYPRLIASADWIANDLYPCGGWLNRAHAPRRGDVTLIAEPLKLLQTMTDKPLFAFVETSEVERGNVPGARAPTPEEVRAEIWLAVIHGARGIFYFPAVVGTNGFQFDGTPPATVEEIKRQNERLTQLSRVLQGPINPPGLTVVSSNPLHVGWRLAEGKCHVFVVNPRATPSKRCVVKFPGLAGNRPVDVQQEQRTLELVDGTLTDDFGPFELHHYVFEQPTTTPRARRPTPTP